VPDDRLGNVAVREALPGSENGDRPWFVGNRLAFPRPGILGLAGCEDLISFAQASEVGGEKTLSRDGGAGLVDSLRWRMDVTAPFR
jgi:hypothetical protein